MPMGELAPESLLEQNCIYYAYLEQLHLRLGNSSGQLKFDFTWYDAEYSASQDRRNVHSTAWSWRNLAFCTI